MSGVDFVFHAAALKQVPSCEFYPSQAVKTNINGGENVVNAALLNHVKKLIALSTDKAVYPINAMGISKAMMEKIVISSSRISEQTICCCTRYGNVMASRGSVIPLFVQQAKKKLPLTVTDPQMTRFMMSLEESVDLVLFAFNNAKPGDIFVQKAPASTILDLAIAIKELFNSDSEIKVIGTRHGEKLHETLLSREEMIKAEDLGKYYRIPADNRDLNYDKYFSKGIVETSGQDDFTSHNTNRLDVESIKKVLSQLSYFKNELK
ncbi:UDP-glucose 4-epimerase [subsurface metagenome]